MKRHTSCRQFLRYAQAAAPLGLAACAQATPVGTPPSKPGDQTSSPSGIG